MSYDNDFDDFENDDTETIGPDVDEEKEELLRQLEVAKLRIEDAERKAARRIPASAPRPQDRKPKKPKKLAQQAEVEDVEIIVTAFGDEFRIRRSALQDNWQFFAASAVGNIPGMLVQVLGQQGFVTFCQRAMEAGKKPTEAAREMWDLIGEELGTGGSGNS
ncbi:hypothetical protein DEU38_13422 [Rhodococcus sp. AG1013]|uniref:hypothetical protein n=1 Tax=Rhodococcus sp. AG1013 TaxID=2183996 RepID=UPI000E0A4235|nr:hypothetical protein [Rhodococcus sp. AG1013]RDI13447.1 hypothetical protein DEU38_13422 [Rhodococcus sp. AG1013]